ncbi:hypothetical protein D9M68_781090 [compost metagenome]
MDKSKSDKTPALTPKEEQEVRKGQPPRAAVVHEIIRVQGDKELQRTVAALWWSAVAAGLSMGYRSWPWACCAHAWKVSKAPTPSPASATRRASSP